MEVLKLAYRKMDQLENRIHKCFEVCGVVLLATAFLSIFVQVLYRFIISRFLILPLSFTEELSRFCLFWLIYLELPITVKQGLESANTFFINRCKGVPKLFLYIVVQCICLFVAVVAFRYSFVVLNTNRTYRSPAMGLPGFMMYVPITIGMLFIFVRYAIDVLGIITKEKEPFENMGQGGVE
ncbi:TRAP transporter small permease [Enterocloster sp. OA13]|uniref:TRAP transporter small permease n=1 Tax=Enterocloster TaxID=2719313 RepID=UPI0004712607|nr:TRAP transporter small permease subunit [Lachnoclostridium pacaense]MCC2878833.1 TRAP transporter small permease [Lachnoclostridium pacaense]MCH1951354.1 TRAP transporter small permease [Enterocloster sp. OA13]RJW54253.1 TRAP transporter small permease subunit [Clostridiales bacterium TF09-2AC]